MRVLIAGATGLSLVLGACAGVTAPAPAGERTIAVEMREFGYSPATISLTPSQRVTLTFKNVGTLEHEFMAGRDAVPGKGYREDWLATAKVDAGGGHDMGHAGSGVRVDARSDGSLTLVVPAEKGVFEFGCFVPGHYEGGMKGRLVVE